MMIKLIWDIEMRLGLVRGSFNSCFQIPGITKRRVGRLDKIFDEFEKLF